MERAGIRFDEEKIAEVESFISCLTLTKCTKSGKAELFEILKHTRRIIRGIYGPRDEDGTRIVRKCFATFGRKQAKTQIAAAIAAFEFFMGDEPMQEIYFAATAADQAAKCYEAIRDMISADPELESIVKITDSIRKIVNLCNGNIMQVLSADGKKQHGSNPSMVVFDELHAWGPAHHELHSALSTGSMSRRQPLWLTITTAGTDIESLWGQEYEYAKQVEAGDVVDPSYLPIIYEVPRDADWTDQSLWHLALPLLETGHHKLSLYEAEFRAALAQPSKQNEFRRLYLNQRTASTVQWVPANDWAACLGIVDESELAGVPCWGGLDLGSTRDLTAFALTWPMPDGRVIVKAWGYIPAGSIDDRCRREGINYREWERLGHVRLTGGTVTDWRAVKDHIAELRQQYKIQQIGFDRWGARDIVQDLMADGFEVVEMGQGYATMSPAVKRAETLIFGGKLVHDGNPALRWNIDCAKVKADDAENKKLVKPITNTNTRRIDMAVAMVMAIGISISSESVPETTFFELP